MMPYLVSCVEQDADTATAKSILGTKLHTLLTCISKTTDVYDIVKLVFMFFQIPAERRMDIYTKITPLISLNYGNRKCCAIRKDFEQKEVGVYIGKRCNSKAVQGTLFCRKHNEHDRIYCDECDTIHDKKWEHYGMVCHNTTTPALTHMFRKKIESGDNVRLLSHPVAVLTYEIKQERVPVVMTRNVEPVSDSSISIAATQPATTVSNIQQSPPAPVEKTSETTERLTTFMDAVLAPTNANEKPPVAQQHKYIHVSPQEATEIAQKILESKNTIQYDTSLPADETEQISFYPNDEVDTQSQTFYVQRNILFRMKRGKFHFAGVRKDNDTCILVK